MTGYINIHRCSFCNKENATIKSIPNRHMLSPAPYNKSGDPKNNHFVYFCSPECEKQGQRERYVFWAELDKNASDSECFEHTGWVTKNGIKYRKGRCKITNKDVTTEPLQPGEVSGQPKECVEHFTLLKRYSE